MNKQLKREAGLFLGLDAGHLGTLDCFRLLSGRKKNSNRNMLSKVILSSTVASGTLSVQ